ncbi:MAG TPA: DUF87 domain-containing protein [Fimbriiglobus sp.]|nr:DUF87 domain-containing protein [Fimbriiglobus sp.]
MHSISRRRQWTATRLVYRHVTGLEYDGLPRTNATWTEAGDAVLHPSGRARRWHYRPRLQRAAVRLAWTAAASGEAYLTAVSTEAGAVAGGTFASAATAWAGYRTVRHVMTWKHRRHVVRPLAKALARPLENTPENILRGLDVPLRPDRPDATVTLPVPDGWHGDRKTVEGIVSTRIGGEWSASWRMLESPFSVHFVRAPAPPPSVAFEDVRDLIENTPDGKVFIGLGTGESPVYIDWKDATPHVGLSCGTGAGKTVLIRGVIAQAAHRSGRVVIVDPKVRSLNCFEGVPGITIHRFIEDQIRAIRDFRESMELGYTSGDIRAWGPEAEKALSGGPQRLLVLEEQNTFATELRQWWAENKPNGAKGLPPTFSDVAKVLFKGRQLGANVLGVYQRLSVAATGMTEARDQYGFKALGRFSPQNWNSLVGTRPVPASSDHPGRMMVVTGGRHRWVQTCYWTEEEAREYALAGRDAVSPVPSPVPTPSLTLVKDVPGTGEAIDGGAEPGRLWTLRDACTAGIVPLDYEAARKARKRTGTLTAAGRNGNADAYTEQALTDWYERHYGPTVSQAR